MDLTIGILSDELPDFSFVARANSPETKIPLKGIETFFKPPGKADLVKLLKRCSEIYASYEAWNEDMLMAVIQHKSIGEFLTLAARKLTNPIAVFDTGLSLLGAAGEFKKSAEGTIWEKIDIPGLTLNSFFTSTELKITDKILSQSTTPYMFHPKSEKKHNYVIAGIRIGGRMYGIIGMVDINAPFTDGQLAIIHHIGKTLALFIGNNDTLMKVAENRTSFIAYLLDGNAVAEEVVSHHLGLLGWNIRDDFFLLNIRCPVPFQAPIHSVPYLKLLYAYFPQSLICVYQDSIILALRAKDYPLEQPKDRQMLEQFLKKTEMRCGVSMVFNNFMRLRCYYTQSNFAAAQCKPPPGPALCLYEDCQTDHVLRTLAAGADLRCFCHPGILSLWESGGETQREMVRSLYHYFLNGKNISAAADAVHVHRNTLIYRLNKAEESLNIDIKQPNQEQAFLYLISCLIALHL
jgi:hypothetical protein